MKKQRQTQHQGQQRRGDITYALIYCRVSSDRQAKEGHGLDAQELRCRDFARRNGYVIEERVFREAASGGGEYQLRAEQVALLEYIDKFPHRKFIVLVDDPSRVARDARAHIELRSILRLKGVFMGSPNFNFEESPEGEVIENVMAVFSEYHRKGNRRQVIQKQKARLDAGYWPFGGKKGYDIVDDPTHGKLAVPNAEGRAIKEGLELFAKRQIIRKVDLCRFLVEKGVWKGQSPEKYITPVTKILKDSFYAGFIEYPEWEVSRRQGRHEALIGSDILGLNQKWESRDGVSKRVRNDISSDFPLRGLLLCDHCNQHITAGWSGGERKSYAYYTCRNKGCEYRGKSVGRGLVETEFDSILKKHALKEEVGKLVLAVFDDAWSQETDRLKVEQRQRIKRKGELELKATQLSDRTLSASSDILRQAYEKQLEDVSREILSLDWEKQGQNDLSVSYRTALERAVGLLKSPYLAWQKLDVAQKHALFFFIFETKLSYNQKTGYRTDKIPYVARLFEEFVTTNSDDVEMARVERACT